ncbi:ER-derived vesicles protein erv29 [Coemansia spiralis]|uniref:ER-derived vesicles protein erv29 n=2 Tax=Coemansia TaxID=4863 RepID=A0A9W8GCG3_9FUNG|nr:SURF4 family-domain-containing protein [Coemansia spiralis]KAJ1994451.1 ER-derived vesicles protein erv29 [Coemansia umbellata]KAJ2624236.1 ER-derived vesicles protein erv29 [Coemansia sp. RSA 1358]KAJ2679361.1 ER-derived vesicles protein erv29 [Coemansia spiralis]
MDQLKNVSEQTEDVLEKVSRPMKPYIPWVARALLVSTFIEDAVRIMVQWQNQLYFLQAYRGFPWGISHFFLFANVVTMLACSGLAISRRSTELAVGGLFAVIVVQGFAYGLIFDFRFFLRNLSVVGGLLMLLAESLLAKRRNVFAGLPNMSDEDRSKYVLLGGRILLVLLFVSFIFSGTFSITRLIVSVIGGLSCVMVAVGFKAKWSAIVLVTILSIFNLMVNNWWSIDFNPTHRDFVKYDFFQTLSIMGGFLLLVNVGPGGFSVDEKKKNF